MGKAYFGLNFLKTQSRPEFCAHPKKATLLLVVLSLPIIFISPTVAGEGNNRVSSVTWSRTYGVGSGHTSIQQTSDGGFVLADRGFGVRVLKLDRQGETQWERDFMPVGYVDAEADSIKQTADRGYIVSGQADRYATRLDALLLKLDRRGNVEWSKTYGGPADDQFAVVEQTSDRGYIAAGSSESGASQIYSWLVKLDRAGNIEWQHRYATLGWTEAASVQQTFDNGFIVAGKAVVSNLGTVAWVFKTDSAGNIIWQKGYGLTIDNHAYSIRQTSDGGYIVIGDVWRQGQYGVFDSSIALFLRLDALGNIIWEKTYAAGNVNRPFSVGETSDQGFIISGGASPRSDGSGIGGPWLLKLDSDGKILWQKLYGDFSDFLSSVVETRNGGLVAAGLLSGYWIWVLRLDDNGTVNGCSMGTPSGALLNDVRLGTTNNLTLTEVQTYQNIVATTVNVSGLTPTMQFQCASLPQAESRDGSEKLRGKTARI